MHRMMQKWPQLSLLGERAPVALLFHAPASVLGHFAPGLHHLHHLQQHLPSTPHEASERCQKRPPLQSKPERQSLIQQTHHVTFT